MPLFFLVGGYSNGASWAATRRGGKTYADWLSGRMQRLINPVLPLFLVRSLFALSMTAFNIVRQIIRMAVQLALVPVWFLAVYQIVSALVPLTYRGWLRYGMGSFWALVAGAVLVDLAAIGLRVPYVNWLNFLFVWLAVHQLGYAWQAGALARRRYAALLCIGALAVLGGLVRSGSYPVAMIGVPGNDLSNSMPPTLALLALGIAQAGLALALEAPLRRALGRAWLWTATVLLNGMIMTVYLWHLTAFVLAVVAAWLLGGPGLDVTPGTAPWWLLRPVWFAVYIAVLLPLIALFVRFEQMGSNAGKGKIRQVALWRLITGMALICAGLALTAAVSIASAQGVSGPRLWVAALPFIGAALIGFGPAYTLARRLGV